MPSPAATFQLVTGGTCMTAISATTRHDWERTAGFDFAAAVAEVPLFRTLGRRQVRRIARNAEIAGFVPGDVVVSGGAPADFFYVVLHGEAELREEGTARRLRHGDYFGETALLDGTHESAAVVATDVLHAMRVPGWVFLGLAQESPSMAFAILRHLGRRVKRDPRKIPRAA
jgi:CRP-like cAMP-binding protein